LHDQLKGWLILLPLWIAHLESEERLLETVSGDGKSRNQKHGNRIDWLKKKVNNTLIEPDWLHILADGAENKVT
jgi:hypothetical protein